MSLRVRFWIVAIVPLLLAVFLITWLFSTKCGTFTSGKRNQTTGRAELDGKELWSRCTQQDKDSLITNALRGDVQLQEEARVRLTAALLPYNQALQNAMPTLGLSYSISLLGGPIAEVKNPEAEGKTRVEILPHLLGWWANWCCRIWKLQMTSEPALQRRETRYWVLWRNSSTGCATSFPCHWKCEQGHCELGEAAASLKESQLPVGTFRGEIGLIASTANELAAELKERTQALNAVMENSPVGLALVKDHEIILKNPLWKNCCLT